MGDRKTCSFPGLINHHHKFIISFAEDEAGGIHSVPRSVQLSASLTALMSRLCSFRGTILFGHGVPQCHVSFWNRFQIHGPRQV